MSTTDEVAAVRAELTALRQAIRDDGEATEAQSERVNELVDELERLEAQPAAQGADFTEEELEKIDTWARTPGVPTSSLPLEFRAAVEHRRDELAEGDDEALPAAAEEVGEPDELRIEDALGPPAIDLPGHRPGAVEAFDDGQNLTELEADVLRRYARVIAAAGRALATYHDRRRRLAALEVRDTQAARQAKTELELGEAREALDAIEAALEEA